MLAKELPTKKQPPRKKTTSNLRILDILHDQAQDRSLRKTTTSKGESRHHVKGRKIDNKTMLQQFRHHIDDFPVVLKHSRDAIIDPFVNNTTLSITKSNAEVESQGRRPGSSVPFQHGRERESRRKQSFSICTNEHYEQDRPYRSKSRSTHKAHESRFGQSDKENRLSQGRHSLIDRRHSRNYLPHHNRSCNDEELLRRSAKSKTPVSRSKVLDRRKNNTSCMDYIEGNKRTNSNEKEKKRKRRASAVLLTKQTVGGTSKQSKKELKKPRPKKATNENPKRRKSGDKDKSKSREKESLRPKPDPSCFRKKKSLNVQRQSEDDDYDYPVSKYINTKKKKPVATANNSQKTFLFTNDLCKKIFTQSSLIRSSVETSKKSSYEFDRNYEFVQRITELEEEGTSVKKKPSRHSPQLGGTQENYSFEFDIREVREFERKKQEEIQHKQRFRRQLYSSIEEEYPQLSQEEVEFLASVIFIQRVWRHIRERRRNYPRPTLTNNLSEEQMEADSSQEPISDMAKSLSQKSNPLSEQQLEVEEDSKSSPDKKLERSSDENSDHMNEPLYKLLMQQRRTKLEKQDQLEEEYKEARASSRSSTNNPLEKYKNYFEALQAEDNYVEERKDTVNITNARPVFKRIKRAADFVAEEQHPEVAVHTPIETEQQKPVVQHSELRPLGNYGAALTERSEYSSINCERQIFPSLEMISERKKVLLFDYSDRIAQLEKQYVEQELNTSRYKEARNELQAEFQMQLGEIKTNNKDIERGYLKYIDFIKKIKMEATGKDLPLRNSNIKSSKMRSNSKLRRASSEDSLMGRLYSRFCNIESFSNDSNSLKELKERLLVRKEYVRKSENERDIAILTIRRNLSRQELLLNNQKYMTNSRSPRHTTTLDMSEKIKIDEGQSFDRYDEQQSDRCFRVRQLDDGHYLRQIRDTINDIQQSSSVSFDNEESMIPQFTLPDEKSLPVSGMIKPPAYERQPANSVINLNDFLSRIKEDTGNSNSPSLINEFTESPSYRIDDSLKKEENSIYLTDQILQLLIVEIHEEFRSNKTLDRKFKQKMEKRRRRLPTINCEVTGVLEYMNALFAFIAGNSISDVDGRYRKEVLKNFNTALGYAPFNFLKMLRDAEFVPPEEYVQIIPDGAYIDLQEIQLSRLQTDNIDVNGSIIQPKFENFLKGITSVHNRAIFETVKIELLRLKPYGEEGLPYPWDPEPLFQKPLNDFNALERQFQKVRDRIARFCSYRCGLLLEKYSIKTAEELERVHQDSEQRLLEVIEEEVREDSSWNFANMQLLETKMDLDTELFSELLEEMLKDMTMLKVRRLRLV